MNQRSIRITGLAVVLGAIGFVGSALAPASLGPVEKAHAIIGMPLTPMSYAGVARRTVRRTSYVAGAAAAASTAAAVSTLPPGCASAAYAGSVRYNCGPGVYYEPRYNGPNVVYVPM